MNIHPSLLPLYGGKGFYGIKVHEQVVKNKDIESGATVHFIDTNYDTGPILIQEKIKLGSNETPEKISEKILKVEHKIYFQALELFCNNKIYWNNNKPLIKG
jgi:folate-dependent phosphoribosylglycinamide formyltransferase PurN